MICGTHDKITSEWIVVHVSWHLRNPELVVSSVLSVHFDMAVDASHRDLFVVVREHLHLHDLAVDTALALQGHVVHVKDLQSWRIDPGRDNVVAVSCDLQILRARVELKIINQLDFLLQLCILFYVLLLRYVLDAVRQALAEGKVVSLDSVELAHRDCHAVWYCCQLN